MRLGVVDGSLFGTAVHASKLFHDVSPGEVFFAGTCDLTHIGFSFGDAAFGGLLGVSDCGAPKPLPQILSGGCKGKGYRAHYINVSPSQSPERVPTGPPSVPAFEAGLDFNRSVLSAAAPLSIIATVPTPVDPHRSVIRQLMEGREVEENFRQLFQTYYPAVSSFFARKGFTHDECRDLAQEVFVAVYVGMENLRSESAFVSWLFSTARHIGFRHLDRRRKSFGAAPAATGGVDEGDRGNAVELAATADPDPLRRVLDQEKVTVLKEALQALPGRVQDCLRARLVEDLSYREIGERLGISENTVAVHVHRGVKTIRARLKLFFGEAPSGGG